jgi:AraC family transcriptional regulator
LIEAIAGSFGVRAERPYLQDGTRGGDGREITDASLVKLPVLSYVLASIAEAVFSGKRDELPTLSNPGPPTIFSGSINALLSGTTRSFCAPNLQGPLSIKAVLTGSGTWELDRRRYVVRENSYLVVNKDQAYGFTIGSAAPTTTLSAFFQHGFVEQVHRDSTEPDSALLELPGLAQPGSLVLRSHLEPGPSAVLDALRAFYVARLQGNVSRTGSEEAFLCIARALVRELPRSDAAGSRLACVRASTRQELLTRVLRGRDCLLSRMDESVSIADAARAACMSQYHFFRTFHAAFQVTPHRFLTAQRLARARMLLRGGRHTVTEACMESGFQSVASFSSLFRRHFGVPPRDELKKRLKNQQLSICQ